MPRFLFSLVAFLTGTINSILDIITDVKVLTATKYLGYTFSNLNYIFLIAQVKAWRFYGLELSGYDGDDPPSTHLFPGWASVSFMYWEREMYFFLTPLIGR